MEGMETPKPASDSRDLMHAKFCAFQEQLHGGRKGRRRVCEADFCARGSYPLARLGGHGLPG